MLQSALRLTLLAAFLVLATLAPGTGASPERAEAQGSRHEFPGLVVDEDGRPVERLTVAAAVQGTQGQHESRVSAAGGTFRLWLVEGTYRLSIWSDTYSKCTVSGIENPEGRPDAVFPVEGEGVTPIRIVVATSDRTQSARWVRCHFDVRFYRVQGTVVGPDQEPVEGIDVRLYGLSSHDIRDPWTGKATGPDGAFAIEVPEGSYRLQLTAELEGGTNCVLGNYGADGRPASWDVTRILVTDGDVSGVVITLTDVPSKLCHEVEVVVTDGEGEPPDRVTFNFSRVLQAASVTHMATTNAAGTVSLPLVGGTYRLYIWSDTYDKCTTSGIENPEGRPDADFSLEGGGASHIGIVVASSERAEAARWVRCNFDVPFYRVEGMVVGPDQEPLEGIHIRLWGLSSDHNLGPWRGKGTGPDGVFSMEVPRGSYRLHFSAELEDDSSCILGNYGADGRRASADMTRLVVTNEDVAGVVITLTDVPSRLCLEIEGVVTDGEGEPATNLTVSFGRLAGSGGESQIAISDAAGAFSLRLRDGTYRLSIWLDAYDKCTVSGIENPDGRPDAVLAVEGERVTPIRIVVATSERTQSAGWVRCHFDVPFYRVRGVVMDAEGNPFVGTSLNFFGHGESQTRITDEAGTFRVHLPDGSYRVTITTDGGSDCTIGGYRGPVPTKGGSIVIDGESVSGLRFVLWGAGREARWGVPCPYREMITTELEPGWNLAGWTGPETIVPAVFEATPQLTAIYSWEGATQSFRGAIRQRLGSSGSLVRLKPGMGLWLFIGGTERVNWTRPLLTESALVPLAEGWNLVSWGGRDGATADDIFNSLGAEPVVAATWNASRERFLLSSTAAPAGANPELQVRPGDALWLQTSREGRWLQPGWPAPDVVLLGDYPSGTEEWYRQNVEEAQAFYAERYGVITSDVTFYFASNQDTLEEGYRNVRGGNPSPSLCADYASQVIFIATYRCFPIAHEYLHAIQDDLSGNNYLWSPTWIVEGSALYTDFQHRYSKGQASYLPSYHFTWATLAPELTLAAYSSLPYGDNIRLGYIAFEWLAGEVGDGAIIDYFPLLKTADTWEEAFQRAFRLTVDDFYARFEEHRREVAPPFEWNVTGGVLDRNSQPVEGIDVWVVAYVEGRLATNLLTPTGADGSFAIENAPGSGYALLMAYNCPGGTRHEVGGYGQEGFTTDGRNARPFTGEDRDRRGLTITLPVTLDELEREHCAP